MKTAKSSHVLTFLWISLLLAVTLGYVDESRYSLAFLYDSQEIGNIFFFTVLIAALPVVLYFIFLSAGLKEKSKYLPLLGFIPAFILIALNLIF
jgi:hypothetical protein